MADAQGRPIRLKLTAGQAHEGHSAADMQGSVGRGQTLLADRAYDSDGLRLILAERGAVANIRLMQTRKRCPAFEPILYKQRNQIERFNGKLKRFRAVATRCDKRDDNFLAPVRLASLRTGLPTYESVT